MLINNTSTYACTPACMYIHYACMCVVYISTSACMLVCGDTRCPSAPALLSLQMGARASDQQWPQLLRSMAATTSQQTPSQLIGWPHSVMYVHIHAICHHAHLPLHLCTCPPPPPASIHPHTLCHRTTTLTSSASGIHDTSPAPSSPSPVIRATCSNWNGPPLGPAVWVYSLQRRLSFASSTSLLEQRNPLTQNCILTTPS